VNEFLQNDHFYWINRWGFPYFTINEKGHVAVCSSSTTTQFRIDLFELVESLVQRGIEAPMLIHFDDIIFDRINYLHNSFKSAIQEFSYPNCYQIAFPIKVNPQRHVIEYIQQIGQVNHLGLEVGSKPELLAVMTFNNVDGLLLCNGYKDAEYVELALMARKLGRRSILIIEQFNELQIILDISQKLGIEAEIGFRMKLSTIGTGRWKTSGGDLAKFGLQVHEIVLCLEILKKVEKTNWLKLLHFHLGSQITSIEAIKKALKEASRMYTELASQCPSLCYFDAGGGLGVDYDGSKTTTNSSMNYLIEEYARDVVFTMKEACQKAKINPPILITESGRAIVAHHAILITEVVDVAPTLDPIEPLDPPPTSNEFLSTLYDLYQQLTPLSCLEALHDAYQLKESILEDFLHGHLNLNERAYAEKTFRHLIAKINLYSKQLPQIPEDIEKLQETLFDTYFCNFSVFQSLPDSWAIEQLFPVMPIHRLNHYTTRKGILADMSCDSDGKIDHFVGYREPQHGLPLHQFHEGAPYYLGVFLVGAYQEVLGGLHNLFGDVNAVHVAINQEGKWTIKHIVEGDTIEEVLSYMQYDIEKIREQLRLLIEKALQTGHLSTVESAQLQRKFKKSLESYTYLTV
jgi:arginine decarboxylase